MIRSLDADAVADALRRTDLPADVRRVLEIREASGSASVKKLYAMENQACRDDRLRDLIKHHGARTGRPTAQSVQPLNLPKAGPKLATCDTCAKPYAPKHPVCPWCGAPAHPAPRLAWKPEMVDHVLEVMSTRSLDAVEWFFGDVLLSISGCIRGLFVAGPGRSLIASDYSAIEAVVAACLAGEQWRIDTFVAQRDIYLMSASAITGIPYETYIAYYEAHGEHHPHRQAIGKIAELALGFMGFVGAWRAFDPESDTKSDDEIKSIILKWRAASPRIVGLAGGQQVNWQPDTHGMEGAAIEAIQSPGRITRPRPPAGMAAFPADISFQVRDFGTTGRPALFMKLPSTRELTYHEPRLSDSGKSWAPIRISYKTENTNPKYGPIGWVEMDTYSGRIWENCIAEGTPVLTEKGWKRIETITAADRVYDGLDFVNQKGIFPGGAQHCIEVDGVWMTPDHEVLCDEGWRNASEVQEPGWGKVRQTDGFIRAASRPVDEPTLAILLRLRKRGSAHCERDAERPGGELWVRHGEASARPKDSRHVVPPSVSGLAIDERPLPTADASGVAELWRARYQSLRAVGAFVRKLLGRHGADLRERFGTGPRGQRCGLFARELPLDYSSGKFQQSQSECLDRNAAGADDGRAGVNRFRDRKNDYSVSAAERLADGQIAHSAGHDSTRRVYDIVDCGPRQRFVVMGRTGPFIVHNCVQAVAHDIQRHGIELCRAAGYDMVLGVYDEDVFEVPEGFGSVEEVERLMGAMPPWAAGWPIRAAGGWSGARYRKG